MELIEIQAFGSTIDRFLTNWNIWSWKTHLKSGFSGDSLCKAQRRKNIYFCLPYRLCVCLLVCSFTDTRTFWILAYNENQQRHSVLWDSTTVIFLDFSLGNIWRVRESLWTYLITEEFGKVKCTAYHFSGMRCLAIVCNWEIFWYILTQRPPISFRIYDLLIPDPSLLIFEHCF